MVSHRDENGQNIAETHTQPLIHIFTVVTLFVVKRDSAYIQPSVNDHIVIEGLFSS